MQSYLEHVGAHVRVHMLWVSPSFCCRWGWWNQYRLLRGRLNRALLAALRHRSQRRPRSGIDRWARTLELAAQSACFCFHPISRLHLQFRRSFFSSGLLSCWSLAEFAGACWSLLEPG